MPSIMINLLNIVLIVIYWFSLILYKPLLHIIYTIDVIKSKNDLNLVKVFYEKYRLYLYKNKW